MSGEQSSKRHLVDHTVMALIAAMPLAYALLTWDHSGSRALTGMRQFGYPVLMLAIGVALFALWRREDRAALATLLPKPALAGLLLVVTIAFLSVNAATNNPGFALLKTIANLVILGFGLALTVLLSQRWQGAATRFSHLLLVALAAYLVVILAYIALAPTDFNWKFFGMTAQNIRNLGSHMMSVGAFAIGAMLVWQGRWKAVAAIVAILAVALLAWSGSRGSYFILLAFSLAAALLFARGQRGRAIAMIGGIFVVGSLLSLVHHVDHPSFGLDRILGLSSAASGSGYSSGRIALWLATIDLLRDMPIWGYGDGQFFYFYDAKMRLAFPHNVMLQLWFQWGWIGGSIAIALFAWLAVAAIGRTLKQPAVCLPGLMILACIGAYGMIDGPFYDTLPMIFFAIAAALCFVSERKNGQIPVD